MKFNELQARKQIKTNRVGRGISAGQGKTAGRGTKGQGARKSSIRAGFEGGQMPLYMRIPKLRGFKSHAKPTEEVYTDSLNSIKAATIDTAELAKAGFISNPYVNTKLIFRGDIETKKTVKLQAASTSAIKAIEAAGGSFEKIEQVARPSKKAAK